MKLKQYEESTSEDSDKEDECVVVKNAVVRKKNEKPCRSKLKNRQSKLRTLNEVHMIHYFLLSHIIN